MDNIKLVMGQLNSFDYLFLAYTLLQIYKGFTMGFRIMVFETIKWFVLAGGILLSNVVLYPYLMSLDLFISYSNKVIDFGQKSALSLLSFDNPLKTLIYQEVALSIPYDKILFDIIIIMVVSFFTRVFITGSLFGKEVKGRVLGMVFGVVKSLVITFLIMSVIAGFMTKSNPQGFKNWQDQSYILSTSGYRFARDKAELNEY